MKVQVSTRVDQNTRDAANAALEDIGLDLSTAMRMFIKRTADLGSLPFSVGTNEAYIPNQDLRVTIAEAKEGKNLSSAMDIDDAMMHLDSLS